MLGVELAYAKAAKEDLEPSYRSIMLEQGYLTETPVPSEPDVIDELKRAFGGGGE